MNTVDASPRPALDLIKESARMFRRLVTVVAVVAATLLIGLPVASASAASPWWQVLDGSRPSNLWEPTDSVQEITATMESTEFGEGTVQRMEVNGEFAGCLGSQTFLGEFGCAVFYGSPAITTAEQLEAALETVYGTTEVSVAGGPVAVAPLVVTVPGRSVAPIGFYEPTKEEEEKHEEKAHFGTASNKIISSGGSGRLVVTVTNLGDGEVNGAAEPVTIVDELPEGVAASGFEAFAGQRNIDGPVKCKLEGSAKVVCTFANKLPSYESIELEIFVELTGEPPVAGAPGTITVTGGGASSATSSQVIKVSPEPVKFGVERFSVAAEEEGGSEAKRAGSHPFQLTTTIQMNAGALLPAAKRENTNIEQPGQPRTFRFTLPAGLVGNTTAVPKCTLAQFYDGSGPHFGINKCPDETAVGVAAATIIEKSSIGFTRLGVPLFNLEPTAGEPAKLGFTAVGVPVVIDTEVDPDNEYRIIATVRNATQLAQLLSSTVSIWGTPGDPRHDSARGWTCAYHFENLGACENPSGASEKAFLRLPVNCSAPPASGVEVEPWNSPFGSVVGSASFTNSPPTGCNQVPFEPSISASPTNKAAGSSSGLDFRLDMPNAGLLDSNAIAEGQAKKVEVTLPEGVTVNPSQADGLAACTPAQFAQETASSPSGAGCPDAAKVGSIQVKTPLIDEEAKGSLYVAAPYDNPFDSLLALYMVAKIPDRGILVKQAGKVELNPDTGQLVTTFDDLPQLPFETFNLHFFEGNRAPLVMPETCGTYDVTARFTPWMAADPNNPQPSEIVTKTSSFTVDQGPNGSACPSGTPPFSPKFTAGTKNNAAGSYSPLDVRLTREDGEQEFTNFSLKLPKGVIGNLSGIPFCSEADIAAARARTGPNGGQEELEHPSCPDASQIGRTLVGAGVGPTLTYAPGKVYLAGPYKGAKLSVVAITTAKVGPFDLGNVVIRQALKVDPNTAEVSTDGSSADPIPHILQGIVVHARDIRIYVDRKDFVLNPTSCERMTAAASVLGSGLNFGSSADDQSVDVTAPFQAADCASLGFKPKLTLNLRGGTKRGGTPRLKAVLTARKGDANIGAAVVTLPHSEFLEQAHIRTVCTRVQFAAGGGNGEKCPKGSVYGRVKAVTPLLDEPLAGPVYLRSSSHELPDLVAALHSGKVDINLVGRIDSVRNGRIRNTFEAVPDAPVTKFTLEMQGGKKGLLVNSQNICRGKHRAIATFIGQNGKRHEFNPPVKAKCGGKPKKK